MIGIRSNVNYCLVTTKRILQDLFGRHLAYAFIVKKERQRACGLMQREKWHALAISPLLITEFSQILNPAL